MRFKHFFKIWIYEESKIIERRLLYRQICVLKSYGNFRRKGKFWSLCSWIRVFWQSYLFAKYVLMPLSLEKYRDRPKIICWLHCNGDILSKKTNNGRISSWISRYVLESGFRVRISSQGLLTIYKTFPENQSGWKVNGTRLFGLFQRKLSGSNVPNSSCKMKWFRLGSFKKQGLWLEAIYFFYYFRL